MKLIYEKTEYMIDGTTAIKTWVETEEGLEPYGDVTVNLAGYGVKPEEGHIFMPRYKMSDGFYEQVCKDIIEEIICPVQIGYGIGVYAKLKPEWERSVGLTLA